MLVSSLHRNKQSVKTHFPLLNEELHYNCSQHWHRWPITPPPKHFMFVFCKWIHAVLTWNTSRLKLPRLLDDEGPGWMGLFHCRSHLAVPHTHRRLCKVMAQLQTYQGCWYPQCSGVLRGTGTNPVCTAGGNLELAFSSRKGLCLPCRVFQSKEYQLAASCWRCWESCKITGSKHMSNQFKGTVHSNIFFAL